MSALSGQGFKNEVKQCAANINFEYNPDGPLSFSGSQRIGWRRQRMWRPRFLCRCSRCRHRCTPSCCSRPRGSSWNSNVFEKLNCGNKRSLKNNGICIKKHIRKQLTKPTPQVEWQGLVPCFVQVVNGAVVGWLVKHVVVVVPVDRIGVFARRLFKYRAGGSGQSNISVRKCSQAWRWKHTCYLTDTPALYTFGIDF